MSFMSGLISGFMAFGGGGALAGAGGAAGAAGSAGAASGAAGAGGAAGAASGAGSMQAGLGAGVGTGAGASPGAPSATSAPTGAAGGEKIGTTSQALTGSGSSGSSSGGGGDIIRENPYGKGEEGPSTSQQIGKIMQDSGKQMQQNAHQSSAQFGVTPYTALFGGSQFGGSPGSAGGGMGAMSLPQSQMTALNRPEFAPIPVQLPQPMALPMQPVMPAPVPVAPLTVSDVRAKYKIENYRNGMDEFLNKVYQNVVSKKRK